MTPSSGEAMPATNCLLTAQQLAARWQVPTSQVYSLTRKGTLPTVELGKYRRYRVDAIEAFEQRGGLAA